MEWQLIETAPKDGTLIHIWIKPIRYAAKFDVKTGEDLQSLVFGGYPHCVTGYWKQSRYDFAVKKYGEDVNPLCGWNVTNTAYEPTHWMPLPEPPKQG